MAEPHQSPAQNAAPAPQAEEPSRDQASPDSREGELRCRKLELEIQQLRRQASAKSFWLEVAKITGPAALLGLMMTIYIGATQLRQAQRARDDDRFDRAVARLASPRTTERVAGVVGLQLFLGPDQRDRHRATLQFLSNALVTEQDATERQAILDTFARLTPEEVGQDVLNATLETLRDMNRRLFALRREKEAAQKFAALTGTAKKAIAEHGAEDSASDEDLSALRATASAIAVLVRRGARTKDLSEIYCDKCDFSGVAWDELNGVLVDRDRRADGGHTMDLSGTDFHESILTNANFTGATLHDSDFDNANIEGTIFYNADLRRAEITSYRHNPRIHVFPETLPVEFPDFNCADLEDANFSGMLFFGIVRTLERQTWTRSYPHLRNANLAHAKLEGIRIFIITAAARRDEGREPEEMMPFEGAKGISSESPQPTAYSSPHAPRSVVTVIDGVADLRVREPVRADDVSSMYGALAELASARNMEESDLPPHIKEFIQRNKGSLLNAGYQDINNMIRHEPCR